MHWWRRLGGIALLCVAGAARADAPFAVTELPGPGRTASADFADLDGDGRRDVFAVSLYGIPPRERRELRVFYQRPDGTLPAAPDWTGALPAGAAAFDVARLPGSPGEALLLLRSDRVSVLSFAGRTPAQRDLPVPGDPTVATAPDERGLDRLRLVYPELGDPPRLLVPALGRIVVMSAEGEVLASLPAGERANYFIPPAGGPVIGESLIEQYYDYPRVEAGDVDGDGRADVIVSSRHELRVYRQREDGGFAPEPSPALVIGRITEEDQIRGTGTVRTSAADLDGDGRVDLLLTYTRGGLRDARSETTVHRNRGGTWDLATADQRLQVEGGWSTLQLADLDGDGHVELVQARVPLSVLEIVEALLTEAVDLEISLYERREDGLFGEEPVSRAKLDVGISLDALDTRGFPPSLEADWNGDGRRDRISSGGGERLELYLGGETPGYATRHAAQPLDTRGALRSGDLEDDGLPDFLIYDRRRPDSPIRVGRNLGTLPGTPREAELRSAEAP